MDQAAELQKMFYSGMLKTIQSSLPPEQFQQMVGDVMKDTMPSGGRVNTGSIFDGGPFSIINDEIYALNIGQSSEFTQWIPTRSVDYLTDEVQHISWGAVPYGFNGDKTYADWLSTIVIPTCGYGPEGTNWDGFTYQMRGGEFSWTTSMMTVMQDSGLKYFEKWPIAYNIRNGNGPINGRITSDKDWALAQLLDVARRHVDFINLYGEKANSPMEWDGLSTIITPGYVQARVVNASSNAAYADPIWANGATLGIPTDPAVLLKLLESMVENRFTFAQQLGWDMNEADCALIMHPSHLKLLHQSIAQGGLAYWNNLFGSAGQIIQTLDAYEARIERMRNTKTLPLGARNIRVIEEINLGYPSNVSVSGVLTPAHTADIFFLCKKVNGQQIIENLFIDWNRMDYPFKGDEDRAEIQGGLARTGWVREANKCYYYYLEMAGRMIVRMMPLQGRISNVTLVLNQAFDKLAQTAFWAPGFGGFNGQVGGNGTRILYGQRKP